MTTRTAAVVRCVTRIVSVFKMTNEMPECMLMSVTRKKSDKRHTRRTKTREQMLSDICEDFGLFIYHDAMAALYNNLSKNE